MVLQHPQPRVDARGGNNAHWRGVAVGIQIRLANELGADGTPVVFTGDYNDRAEVFCPIVGGTELEAANGGGYSGGCDTPDRMDVDWIFGSEMEFSGFVSASQGVVGRVSDHPFIYAEAYIPEEPLGGEASPRATRRRPATAPDGDPPTPDELRATRDRRRLAAAAPIVVGRARRVSASASAVGGWRRRQDRRDVGADPR